MSLEPSILPRLTFTKYLYSLGIQQSRAPEPLAGASILMFHDAADLFLQLASEYLNANPGPKANFLDYWPALSDKLHEGKQVAQLESTVWEKKHSDLDEAIARLAFERRLESLQNRFGNTDPDSEFRRVWMEHLQQLQKQREKARPRSSAHF